MKFVREFVENVSCVDESCDNGATLKYIQGVFLQADVRNENRRVYPLQVLQEAVNVYTRDFVDKARAFGELGHPPTPTINLDRVSHRIVELKQDGKNFVGKALITETPMGRIVRGLLESGSRLGVSSRGVAEMSYDPKLDAMVIQRFHISTAGDIVANPSAPAAFVEGVLENVEWFYDATTGNWLQETKPIMASKSVRSDPDKMLSLFNEFLNLLRKSK